MKNSTKNILWPIITFFIGTLFGSGSIWQWQNIELSSNNLELEKIVKTTELRTQMGELYSNIIELSDEYIKTNNAYYKQNNKNDYIKLYKLRSQLNIIKDDFKVLEIKLAKLENRTARDINIHFLPPSKVKGIGIARPSIKK